MKYQKSLESVERMIANRGSKSIDTAIAEASVASNVPLLIVYEHLKQKNNTEEFDTKINMLKKFYGKE